MSSDSVIQKIRALLARASEDSNDNPFERDAAMRHAHRLMEEHALSMLEVTEDVLNEVSRGKLDIGILNWKRSVVSLIASLYGCAVAWPANRASKNFGSVYIYGRENNRLTVESISDFVIDSIEREWQALRKKEKLKDGDKRSFCIGAVLGVRETIQELKDARREEAGTSGKALALINQYQRWEDEAKDAVTVTRIAEKPSEVKDLRLAAKGKRFGRKVRLEPQLAEGD